MHLFRRNSYTGRIKDFCYLFFNLIINERVVPNVGSSTVLIALVCVGEILHSLLYSDINCSTDAVRPGMCSQLAEYSVLITSFKCYKVRFYCLPRTSFALLNGLSTSLYQLLRCFRHWATHKWSVFFWLCLVFQSAPRQKLGDGSGALHNVTGWFVSAPGGVESLGRNWDLLHGALPSYIRFTVAQVFLARDLGAHRDVTSLIKNCRYWCVSLPCRTLQGAGNLIHVFVKIELQRQKHM